MFFGMDLICSVRLNERLEFISNFISGMRCSYKIILKEIYKTKLGMQVLNLYLFFVILQ